MRPQVTAKEFYIDADAFSGDGNINSPIGLRVVPLSVSDIQLAPYADPAVPNAINDEFNGALPLESGGVYTRINPNLPLVTSVQEYSTAYITIGRFNVNEVQGYVRPFAPGASAFTLEARMNMSGVGASGADSYPACGIGITDGTRYCFADFLYDVLTMKLAVHHWSTMSSFFGENKQTITAPSYAPLMAMNGWPHQKDILLRFRRDGNDAYAGVSFNGGYNWAEQAATNTLALFGPITGCGLMMQNTGSQSRTIFPRYGYLRRVA